MFGENEWKEKDIPGNKRYAKNFWLKKKNGHTELPKKENELLYRDFGYKNIDESIFTFDNTKTDKEFDNLINKTDLKLNTLKKLVKIVSNTTEKE